MRNLLFKNKQGWGTRCPWPLPQPGSRPQMGPWPPSSGPPQGPCSHTSTETWCHALASEHGDGRPATRHLQLLPSLLLPAVLHGKLGHDPSGRGERARYWGRASAATGTERGHLPSLGPSFAHCFQPGGLSTPPCLGKVAASPQGHGSSWVPPGLRDLPRWFRACSEATRSYAEAQTRKRCTEATRVGLLGPLVTGPHHSPNWCGAQVKRYQPMSQMWTLRARGR